MSSFQFFVNGDWIEFDDFEEDWSLAHAIRDRLSLTGTKIACGTGGCGSCTVLVSKFDKTNETFRHFTVNSCITPIYSVYGCHVLTIEGVANNEEGTVHPIQEFIARENGTQCGFCSPGMVLSMFGLQTNQKEINVFDIKTALQGNLCRCTGYRPILQAFNKCAKSCTNCTEPCKTSTDIEDQIVDSRVFSQDCENNLQYPHIEGLRKLNDPKQNIVEIETLLIEYSKTHDETKEVGFEGPNLTWFIPSTIENLMEMVLEYPDALLVAGCASETLQKLPMRKSDELLTVIDITSVPELKVRQLKDSSVKLGSALTINEMGKEINELIKTLPAEKTKILQCLKKLVHCFGSSQIRNVVTIGGSLGKRANYSDLQTFCEGFGVDINYLEPSIENDVVSNTHILSSIDIPLSNKNEHVWFEKISRRKDCDTAILNIAVKLTCGESKDIHVAFGGLAIKRFSLQISTSEESNSSGIGEKLMSEIQLQVENKVKENILTGISYKPTYIEVLAKSLLKKFEIFLKEESEDLATKNETEDENDTFKSTQLYSVEEDGPVSTSDLAHKSIPHASAYKHATGEARFCDDTPKFRNELELAFVLSTRAHAKIVKIDYKKALAMDGVVGCVSHKDLIPGRTKFGLVEKDEEIFASEKVTACGQIVAGIVANDRLTARKAAKLVKIVYENLEPTILTNEDAIFHNSYYEGHGMKLARGDCKNVFGTSPYIISGEVKINSQEHFYMEPQSCIAIPKGEDKDLEIISSTQNPTGVQMEVSHALNIPANRVVVKVKRVGGGFGGKEVRCLMVALPTAVAANKFGKPVRCILDRETDMIISGKRHHFFTRHKIAFDEVGKLHALRMSVYANAGNTLDVSMAPIERVLLNLDNAYNLENLDLEGFVCKTNIPSNTVFRGTGAPQAAFLIENIMDTIASTLNKDPVEVRQIQLYKEGDVTAYGQPIVNCTVKRCWEECIKMSEYQKRKLEIDEFNSVNKYRKRGLSLNPCNFGIGYTALHLNQGSALVHIYTDGSVLITHGGVEIGQGVHTKMIQVATRELGIPASKIRISETSTDKVPNSTPSSASVTSDLNGMAVLDACKQLIQRLQPYYIANPDATWEDLVSKAYMDRVSLSVTGFHKVPDMGWNGKEGSPWNYFSTGAACTMVEVDCLIGKFQILSTNIVMDVGKSLNPSIDIGQIEGAFMQGVGFFLLEELVINKAGELETFGPSTYKIPTASDAPLEFNVSLLTESVNPKAIYSSKTCGEPPLLLSTSVFFAVKDAIRSFRKSNGLDTIFHMDSPATIEQILMYCQI